MKIHQIKSIIFNILNQLPPSLGFYCYHQLQRLRERDLGKTVEVNRKSLQTATRLLAKINWTLDGKRILEIGSGWMPLMPYLFLGEGQAEEVHTYDLNRHYSARRTAKLNAYARINHWPLDPLLIEDDHQHTGVHYHPNENLVTAPLPTTVDLVFSRFVLEHVTPEDLLAMHQKFAKELSKGTLVLHLISPSDHRAFSDSSLSHYDFLRYSKQEWAAIQTKFDYHNRLRMPHYLDIFQQAGLELLHVEYDAAQPGTTKWEKYRTVPIHPDYQSLTDDERTAGSINVLLKVC